METAAGETVDASAALRRLPAQLATHADFSEVLASLAAGQAGTLGGVWGSSRALVAAALGQHCPRTLTVVLPHAADVDSLVDDLTLFTDLEVEAFPATEADAGDRVVQDENFGQRQRLIKRLVGGSAPRIVVTSIQSLLQPLPSVEQLAAATQRIAVGKRLDLEAFTRWLAARGCRGTTAVELAGEFSLRGGILDVFPPDATDPLRIELFDEEVESIRTFDVATQRSLESLSTADVTVLGAEAKLRTHFAGYLPTGSWFMLVEPSDLEEEGKHYHRRLEHPEDYFATSTTLAEVFKFPSVTAAGVPAGSYETTAHLQFESVEQFSGDVARVRGELESAATGQHVYLVCDTEAEVERLSEVFRETKLARDGRLHFARGRLAHGFRVLSPNGGDGIILVSAAELFHRTELSRPAQRPTGRAIDSFLQLREGDLVVHLAHGIGRYRGLKLLDKEAGAEEHLELEYAEGTRIFVPTSKIELVQKYVGGRKAKPTLAKIGGTAWLRQKKAAERAVEDLAVDMLQVQAAREARPGISFPADTPWQQEFDAAFPYQETPDQLTAIAAIKQDMQLAKPMDRLLCGDVGFGKTEMAIRAAFKAIDAGYQVAVLVPTTILAEQHRRTFTQRMAEFPFQIAAVSRFCTAKEEREILKKTADGTIDLLIGTHRLASPDVRFQNLGLVIIDEEQRFGVAVKERLKALRASVDVLTMTATPIPRTLHMSLLGVRSISNLETAPKDRLAVETRIARFDDALVRHAILRELNRGGQAYFVHNRIHDIQKVAHELQRIVPEATIGIGHGQLSETELEDVMLGFVRHEFDILLATTIVESGLDIPNANTIFIDDADRYGLADLHQLRGRVGRYKHRAYCYLLVDQKRHLSAEAARRLRAIEEFSQMGAGFALAMRDLELRGAGNLLGTQQSGHIAAVGYELYCALLEKAVRDLKKLPPKDSVDVSVDLPVAAYFPERYLPDMRTKIDLYRRLARISTESDLEEFRSELADRFGELPPPVEQLVELGRLRIWAHRRQLEAIHLEGKYAVLTYASRRELNRLVERSSGSLRVADAQSAYLVLGADADDPDRVLARLKSLLRPNEADS
ncbi:transcription-repair coupling factor [Lacipirellula limnantheis]|uniref:Transcription-repair-coupling factor n=1 Tax=Lacipirellula limnantheis TaxID=2528024 RepID=A0A517TSW7_9BACT|nr:transcription-repair coupling factor [Lacipirellula limnantheis]QDT71466.1 Transcription-repair-coupling factor [Lacipirellula limnantheis]